MVSDNGDSLDSHHEETKDESTDFNQQHQSSDDSLGDDTEGKLFIGGLNWKTTKETLIRYFGAFGEVTDASLFMDKRTGEPRGFGFVKMRDPAVVDIILANTHTIDGRMVDAKRALSKSQAPGPAKHDARSTKVFVGGLPPDLSVKGFGDFFMKFGPVKEAVIMIDRNTGRSRCFGFITFESVHAIDTIFNTVSHSRPCLIDGKQVEIKRAEPKDATLHSRAGPLTGHPGSHMGSPAGVYGGSSVSSHQAGYGQSPRQGEYRNLPPPNQSLSNYGRGGGGGQGPGQGGMGGGPFTRGPGYPPLPQAHSTQRNGGSIGGGGTGGMSGGGRSSYATAAPRGPYASALTHPPSQYRADRDPRYEHQPRTHSMDGPHPHAYRPNHGGAPPQGGEESDHMKIQTLVNLGFSEADSSNALRDSGYDVKRAAAILLAPFA